MSYTGKMSALGDGDATFYDSDFMTFLESILPQISDIETVQAIAVDRSVALSCRGDFYRLLTKNLNDTQIPRQYWWIIARVNGLASPDDYTGESTHVILPDFDTLNTLATKYNATQSSGTR